MLDPTTTQASPISTPAPGPRDVVASFLRLTVDTPDLKKARLHLTRRSVASGSFDAAAVPAGSTYTLGAEEADELGRRIPVSVKSPVPGGADIQEMTVPVIVVQEEGQWKIDLPATMERLMGGMTAALGQAMDAMGSTLSTTMDGVSQAMAAGMGAEVPARVASGKPAPRRAKAAKKRVKSAAKKTSPKSKKKAVAKLSPRKRSKKAAPGAVKKSPAKRGKKRR